MQNVESLVRTLTVVSFALLCWVAHRSVQARTDCVSSPYINLVKVDGRTVFNCRFESRLSFEPFLHPLKYQTVRVIESLESINELSKLWPTRQPKLTIEIVDENPEFFEIGMFYVRLGRHWLDRPEQLHRALIMGAVKSEIDQAIPSRFELEIVTDFLALSLFDSDNVNREALRALKFSTAAPSFESYCKSPFRSLIHERDCHATLPGSEDLYSRVWGYRPLLAVALWRVFDKVSLKEKVEALRRLRGLAPWPLLLTPFAEDSASLALWFTDALQKHLQVLGLNRDVMALRRTLKELEVESPTHWELTVDLTNTPAWREILEQLRTRSRYRPKERTLVFTPEGSVALPSGFPVEWAASDISSQKHVMIACGWPAPDEAIAVKARHTFAEKSCGKLTKDFWN